MSDPRARKLQEVLLRQNELVQQLREEKRLHRIKCSQTIADLVSYMEENNSIDHLLVGFHKPSDNPFHEKGKCTIV